MLVSNFGDGLINAFDIRTGDFLGSLSDASGNPIVIDGLGGLAFSVIRMNGRFVPAFFFSAGPKDETPGVVGRITPNGN
jgi:hypothetical protein